MPFDLTGCGEDIDFDREILSCSGGVEGHSESGPALEPGETYTVEWTATVPPRSEWSEDTVFMDGPTFWAHVKPNDWDADVLVRDNLLANSRDDHKFTE